MNDCDEKVIGCVTTLATVDEVFTGDHLTSLGIDSLGMVELLVALEDLFGIAFDDSALNPDELTTVGSVIDLVRRHLLLTEEEQDHVVDIFERPDA